MKRVTRSRRPTTEDIESSESSSSTPARSFPEGLAIRAGTFDTLAFG
jgi:hypothetical protein